MSKSMLKIFTRVIKRRMDDGENFDDIIKEYPKLSEKEIEDIKKAIE